MKLITWFNCLRGKHHRSRGQARQDGDVFRSRCRGCGTPMIRERHGWVVDRGERTAGA